MEDFIEDIKIDAFKNKVLIELKSVDKLSTLHYKQVLTYLRLANLKLGLLINFNVDLVKDGIKRIAEGDL